MGYTQYFSFKKDISEGEFREICDFIAQLAVTWYQNGNHGDAFISLEQKGGKYFSSGDALGLSEMWKSQNYICLWPETQDTEALVIECPLNAAFNFCKTHRKPDFCPLVSSVYKGLEKLEFGKASHDGYYYSIRKGRALLKNTFPELH